MNRIFIFLEYLLIFILFFMPLVDTDFGWHLRSGQYFLEHFQFEKYNSLTYFLSGYYWPNSYMTYDVIVAFIYKYLDLNGLSAIYGVLGVLGYWLFRKIIQKNNISLILCIAIYLFSYTVFNLGFRAQFLTFIFIELELFVLLRKLKWIYSFPILFALWANTHGAFVLGLAIFGLYILQNLFEKEWRRAVVNSLVLVLCSLTVLVNPYGIGVYEESLLHANYPLDKLIAEWVPPSWGIGVLVISALGGFGWLMMKEWKKNIFLLLCLLLFSYLAVSARRNIPLWALVASITFAQVYKEKWFKFAENLQLDLLKKVGIICGILILLLIQFPRTIKINTESDSFCTGVENRLDLPCEAIEYIKKHPLDGKNVFTAYEWGGFLEWQLPQYKYFSDGRMVTWDNTENKSPYTIYLEIIQAQPGWNERMRAYGTDWMIIGKGTFLDIELKNNPQNWKEVYRDQIAVIYSL